MSWLKKKHKEVLNYLHMSPSAYKFDSFVRSWNSANPIDWQNVNVPFEPQLVSIILPAFNGEEYISEAMDSILAQTYRNIEVIAVNDGSHDKTGKILDSYAANDPRVKVYHQQNRKLPMTLSRGVRLARGEFLTWTSIDNRLKRNCIEKLVGSMRRNPRWDMVYANMDIIDASGNPLTGSDWYTENQVPKGSEHIQLPADTSALNMWECNYIGAAFLYRARVAFAIGDYSSARFLTEDFDYWMRVNSLMTLRHADFSDCIYDYRYHDNSLTGRHRELGITSKKKRLARFDDFRRSFYLSKCAWIVTDDGSEIGQDWNRSIRQELEQRESILFEADNVENLSLARLWMPVVHLHCADSPRNSHPLKGLHDTACHVYLCPQQGSISNADWDLCITTGSTSQADLLRLEDGYRGWWSVSETSDLVSLCDIQAKNKQLSAIELQAVTIETASSNVDSPSLSVVICTSEHSKSFEKCLRSLMMQTLESQKYEIILVNNDPSGTTLDSLVRKIQSEFNGQPCPRTTLVDCPLSGLSHARNAGLSESLGDLVVFIDDDAMAKSDCLQHLADAYATIPNLGVIGGRSRFNSSDPRPEIRRPDLERLRSQVSTNDTNCKEVKNWWEFPSAPLWGASRRALFDMGGFRCNFGRCGCDLRGGDGDEIVAGLQARNLGYSVWIEPRAEVLHEVDNQRDTRQQIEQAITSDLMLGYQLQTGLYLTEESTLVSSSRNDIYYLSARLAHFAKRLFLRSGAQASTEREYALARAKGRVLVLKQKVLDVLRRFYKPSVRK